MKKNTDINVNALKDIGDEEEQVNPFMASASWL